MTASRTPPTLAERLLIAALGPGEWSESIVGDLHEEHAARADRGAIRASIWYWMAALRLSGRGLSRRARRPRSCPTTPISAPAHPGDSLMRTLGIETRYALRSIVKRPLLSATVVVTLALGLGANAAVFSMIDALLLRPYTLRDVDRVTLISYTLPDDIDRRESVSPADFIDMRRQADVFEHFSVFEWWTANLVGTDEPENVLGFRVTSGFFAALGVEPVIGRTFRPEEETVGRDRQLILSNALWQRRFGGDRSIVGRAIEVDGVQREVVGIMPEGFDFPMGAQMWAPQKRRPTGAPPT